MKRSLATDRRNHRLGANGTSVFRAYHHHIVASRRASSEAVGVVTATGERRRQATGKMRRLSNFSGVTPRSPGISPTTALHPERPFAIEYHPSDFYLRLGVGAVRQHDTEFREEMPGGNSSCRQARSTSTRSGCSSTLAINKTSHCFCSATSKV
jgi:hypothetical protein